MTAKQPQRVRYELPGGGVVLENVCAMCREGADGIICPICNRLFCAEVCFGVHLVARDEHDSDTAIESFLASPIGEPFRNMVEENSEGKVDWHHARSCDDCSHEIRETLFETLVDMLHDEEEATEPCE